MAMNPEIQRKAQVELDAVIGTNRLPEPSDLQNLVFDRASIILPSARSLSAMKAAGVGAPARAPEV